MSVGVGGLGRARELDVGPPVGDGVFKVVSEVRYEEERLCGAYMRPTGDEPPRFDLDAFPTAEWSQLASAGERI